MTITVNTMSASGEIKIFKNFLPSENFMQLQSSLTDLNFPWYLQSVLGEGTYKKDHFKNSQFVHVFYRDHHPSSPYTKLLETFIDKIKCSALIRIKANLLSRTEKKIIHGLHTDTNIKNTYTGILYINNNDGETIFKNGEKFKSEANTFITFPSNMEHTGTTNTCDQAYRMVLNVVYFQYESYN